MTPLRRVHAALVLRLPPPTRPVLVVVDGGDGAGKTEFAEGLGFALADAGRTVVRASLDDFHHPRAHRHARGRTGETVWERSVDTVAIRRELIHPWRSGPGAAYRRRWHDLATDQHVDDEPETVPEDGVLVVDGVFAQRPELAGAWDLAVWLEVPDEVRVARLAERDGTATGLRHPDQQRYLDAQRLYRERCLPSASADVVVDNTDWTSPRIVRD